MEYLEKLQKEREAKLEELKSKDIWKEILKENETIKRGIDDNYSRYENYAPCAERIKSFYKIFPDGAIKRDVHHRNNGKVLVEAKVYAICGDESSLLANGFAEEERDIKHKVNREHFIENAETSAINRALRNCGFGLLTEYKPTTLFGGQEYITVEHRIFEFRSKHPLGRIESDFITEKKEVYKNEKGEESEHRLVFFKSKVYANAFEKNIYNYCSEATAVEDRDKKTKEGKDTVNTKNCVENAETSSIGRALGIGGYMTGSSISSADEVYRNGKPGDEPILDTAEQVGEQTVGQEGKDEIMKLLKKYNQENYISAYLKHYSVDSLEKLTTSQFEDFKQNLISKGEENNSK